MKIFLKFEPDLNFFLPEERRHRRFEYELNRRASVKDIIESLGVPHTEIGQITFEGQLVDFFFIPVSSGTLHVAGILMPFNVLNPSYLRPDTFDEIRFIADVNVIRLGRLLILLGFDVEYSSEYSDSEIADIAQAENRIVLTRDTELLKRKKVVYARRVKSDLPYDQLVEVVSFFGLKDAVSFFSRCTGCNVVLEPVEKGKILDLLEPKTKKYFNTFFRCPHCLKVFWKGSHFDNIKDKMSRLGLFIPV